MNFLITAVAFIVIFSILVLIHEWGHFIVAKRAGIKVEEFGFGLPPRIWGFKRKGMLYSINAIPFGGFVRLLGEDAHDAKVAKNPKAFVSKPLRVRAMVVLAGVFMNFLLAFLLLTIGFIFGIQPLIVSGEDVLNKIQDGTIQIQPGVIVKEVKPGSPASQAGLLPGDDIVTIDGQKFLTPDQLTKASKAYTPITLEVQRAQEKKFLQIIPSTLQQENEGLGFSVNDLVSLPRLQIHDLDPLSTYYAAGLRTGDVLLKINNEAVYMPADLDAVLLKVQDPQFMVLRDRQTVNFNVPLPVKERVIISDVLPYTPAEKSGFHSGDVIISVNDQPVLSPPDLVNITRQSAGKILNYKVRRGGGLVDIQVVPDKNGLIGVSLSLLFPYQNKPLSVFSRDIPTSVLKINDVRYPFWIAPVKALEESARLSVLTVQMFGNVIGSIVTRFTIPEGVAGPVGIAQLTYTFVQQGVLSLLRFMALLSLSLAIINVLPFPALDGGRLLFIVIEAIFGKRINGKYEAIIHTIGFFLLMALIVAVTYTDILRIFFK